MIGKIHIDFNLTFMLCFGVTDSSKIEDITDENEAENLKFDAA